MVVMLMADFPKAAAAAIRAQLVEPVLETAPTEQAVAAVAAVKVALLLSEPVVYLLL
jgi:hypothetical protein